MIQSSALKNIGSTKLSILFICIALIIGFLIGTVYGSTNARKTYASQATQTLAPTPLTHKDLNKSYSFSIKDSQGKDLTNLTYILQNVETMNQVIIAGQRYNAVAGKEFLIINIKLINPSDHDIQIPTRSYVRLSTNNGHDWYAADIHNDPVQVQAISSKLTRIGFPIDANVHNIQLQVGEVDGKKDLIKLYL